MKYTILPSLFTLAMLASCANYQRIGNLTMISTRNVDSNTEYVLVAKNVEAVTKMKNDDALQQAIDEAVKEYPSGEFMKNVSIYVKSNGKRVKVSGDVWGIKSVDKNITTTVNLNVEFKPGDKVTWKNGNKLQEGQIVGLNNNGAIVEYEGLMNRKSKTEVKFEELTKISTN